MKKYYLLYILLCFPVLFGITSCTSSQPVYQGSPSSTAAYDREKALPDQEALDAFEAAETRADTARLLSMAIESPAIYPRDWDAADNLYIRTLQQKKTSTLRETQESTARFIAAANIFDSLNEKTFLLYNDGMEEEMAAARLAAARYISDKEQAALNKTPPLPLHEILQSIAPSSAAAIVRAPAPPPPPVQEAPPPEIIARLRQPPPGETTAAVAAAPASSAGQIPVPQTAAAGTPSPQAASIVGPQAAQRNRTPVAVDKVPLPAQYTVRSWRYSGDTLISIASRPWVYNDPAKWRILYEANKSRMPQPNNPNLIAIGMVLDIPSIKGELRQGMWNENLNYPVFE